MTNAPPSRSLLGLALLIAGSVAITLAVVTPTISLDDPFIGLRYAKNAADGHGIVYNPGEPVEGYTAFLWLALAIVGIALGFEPLGFWQVGGILSQVATLVVLHRLAQGSGRSANRALLAPALLAAHVSFVYYPITGMETTFLTLLIPAMVLLIDREAMATTAGSMALGAVGLLICLTRFDAFILVGLGFLWELLRKRSLRRLLPALGVMAVGLFIYHGWRLWFYGALLPNTFHAKSSVLSEQVLAGIGYVSKFLFKGGPYWLLLILLPLLWRRTTLTMRLCLFVTVPHFLYMAAVGGDWMNYHRFVLPVLPLICVLFAECAWILYDVASEKTRPLVTAGLAVCMVVNLVPLAVSDAARHPEPGPYWSPVDAQTIGIELDRKLPPDALVAVEWAGIIPYYLRQPVLDIFGLSDLQITSGEFPGSRMGRGVTPEFLVERKPEIVVFSARVYPTAEAASVGTACRPEGTWVRKFYSSLDDPKYGYETCVMPLADGYWPFLVRSASPLRDELCEVVVPRK